MLERDFKTIETCICGRHREVIDTYWLKAAFVVLVITVTILSVLQLFGILLKLVVVIALGYSAILVFLLLRQHKLHCALRGAIIALLRFITASPTHE